MPVAAQYFRRSQCGNGYRRRARLQSHIFRNNVLLARGQRSGYSNTYTKNTTIQQESAPTTPHRYNETVHTENVFSASADKSVCFEVFDFYDSYADTNALLFAPTPRLSSAIEQLPVSVQLSVKFCTDMSFSSAVIVLYYEHILARDRATQPSPTQKLEDWFPTAQYFQ